MKTIFAFIFLLILSSCCFAEQIYTYTDKDGNTVISNTPVPDQFKGKAKKVEAYKPLTPEERTRLETKEQALQKQREREEKEDARKKADEDYRKKELERTEALIADSKKRKEEADAKYKKAWEENDRRRFFNSKLGKY